MSELYYNNIVKLLDDTVIAKYNFVYYRNKLEKTFDKYYPHSNIKIINLIQDYNLKKNTEYIALKELIKNVSYYYDLYNSLLNELKSKNISSNEYKMILKKIY